MKQLRIIPFLLLALHLTVTMGSAKVPQAKNLFIIVMNGVRYEDAYGDKNKLYIDNIWTKLRPLGTIFTKFDNPELTVPIPAQMSLLTGVWHVLENPLNDSIHPAFPTLFEYWNRVYKKDNNTCYFASNLAGFENLSYSEHNEYGKNYAPFFDIDTISEQTNAVYENVMPYILENKPSFVYLSLTTGIGGIGTIGGMKGVDCEPGFKDTCAGDLLNRYYESIILMDAIVFDLWGQIQEQKEYKDNTVFLVLSSHGRHTFDFHSFGCDCKGCRTLFMLAMGPGIKKDYVSKKKRTLVDICKTVGYIFDIPTPYAKGKIMKEMFN